METWRKELYSRNVIKHFGVLGMKWGVRRYQKENGEYTKAGLERYKQAESKYDSAHAKYKETKAKYKRGEASKEDVQNAKSERKSALNSMKVHYKEIKAAKEVDEGDKLISKKKDRNLTLKTVGKLALVNVGANIISKLIMQEKGPESVKAIAGMDAIGRIIASTYILGSSISKANKIGAANTQHFYEYNTTGTTGKDYLDKYIRNKKVT